MCAEFSVDLQREERGGEDREGQQDQNTGQQDVPGEDRHAEHRHAGRAHADDRGDEVDRTEDRAEAGEGQTHDPHVGTDTRRTDRVRQRGVGEPAEVGRTLRGEEAADGDQRAEEVQPVREHVQPRERHVGRADLQRHDPVREPCEQRRREHQQHDRAVHRERLVELLVRHDLRTRTGQLRAHEEREKAADAEEGERRDQVHRADRLVVSGGQPLDDDTPRLLAPHRQLVLERVVCCRGTLGFVEDAHSLFVSAFLAGSVCSMPAGT